MGTKHTFCVLAHISFNMIAFNGAENWSYTLLRKLRTRLTQATPQPYILTITYLNTDLLV